MIKQVEIKMAAYVTYFIYIDVQIQTLCMDIIFFGHLYIYVWIFYLYIMYFSIHFNYVI